MASKTKKRRRFLKKTIRRRLPKTMRNRVGSIQTGGIGVKISTFEKISELEHDGTLPPQIAHFCRDVLMTGNLELDLETRDTRNTTSGDLYVYLRDSKRDERECNHIHIFSQYFNNDGDAEQARDKMSKNTYTGNFLNNWDNRPFILSAMAYNLYYNRYIHNRRLLNEIPFRLPHKIIYPHNAEYSYYSYHAFFIENVNSDTDLGEISGTGKCNSYTRYLARAQSPRNDISEPR